MIGRFAFCKQLVAFEFRHLHVGQDQINLLLLVFNVRESETPIDCGNNIEIRLSQDFFEQLTHIRVVFDNQNSFFHSSLFAGK